MFRIVLPVGNDQRKGWRASMRSLIDTIPLAYVLLYQFIRSPLVCLSICVRIVSIVYPSFTMHSKTAQHVSIPDVVMRYNTARALYVLPPVQRHSDIRALNNGALNHF
jgi:hypothetical protein